MLTGEVGCREVQVVKWSSEGAQAMHYSAPGMYGGLWSVVCGTWEVGRGEQEARARRLCLEQIRVRKGHSKSLDKPRLKI